LRPPTPSAPASRASGAERHGALTGGESLAIEADADCDVWLAFGAWGRLARVKAETAFRLILSRRPVALQSTRQVIVVDALSDAQAVVVATEPCEHCLTIIVEPWHADHWPGPVYDQQPGDVRVQDQPEFAGTAGPRCLEPDHE
jgi:hypothetical protein